MQGDDAVRRPLARPGSIIMVGSGMSALLSPRISAGSAGGGGDPSLERAWSGPLTDVAPAVAPPSPARSPLHRTASTMPSVSRGSPAGFQLPSFPADADDSDDSGSSGDAHV
jgi:hypothetical protein